MSGLFFVYNYLLINSRYKFTGTELSQNRVMTKITLHIDTTLGDQNASVSTECGSRESELFHWLFQSYGYV